MATALACILLALAGASAQAATYVCETKHAYALERGALERGREDIELFTWRTVVFDSDTGILRFGREDEQDRPGHWIQERLTVASKGDLVVGHYKHNGTIFSALEIKTWTSPPSFLWLRGGNSDVLTGTCRKLGR